jgi:hypothetical protein
MGAIKLLEALRNEAQDSCRGKNWLIRLPLLAWFGYLLIRHWADPMYNSVLGMLNLGIHGLGHFVTMPLGQFICAASGTTFQVAAPFAGMYNFYRQKDFFALALCFGWLSTSLFDVARYVADASRMEIPLYTPFWAESVVHDWNYLLGAMGLLGLDGFLAFLTRCAASVSMFICLIAGGWLLARMKGAPLSDS